MPKPGPPSVWRSRPVLEGLHLLLLFNICKIADQSWKLKNFKVRVARSNDGIYCRYTALRWLWNSIVLSSESTFRQVQRTPMVFAWRRVGTMSKLGRRQGIGRRQKEEEVGGGGRGSAVSPFFPHPPYFSTRFYTRKLLCACNVFCCLYSYLHFGISLT